MRLFIAFDLDDSARKQIARFMEGIHGFAPEVRWMRPESLHVTLKFIGQWPDEKLPAMEHALGTIRSESFEMSFRDYGFFPTPRSPRVFWIGIHAASQLATLASATDALTASLGVAREEHPFSPHLTLARRARGSGTPRKLKGDGPSAAFSRLQEKLAAMNKLEFGTMTAQQFSLFRSELSPGGSRYTKLASFPLT